MREFFGCELEFKYSMVNLLSWRGRVVRICEIEYCRGESCIDRRGVGGGFCKILIEGWVVYVIGNITRGLL